MNKKSLCVSLSLCFFVACGGGGGGSETPTQSVAPPPPAVPPPSGTAALVAPSGFDFATSREVTFEIHADAFLNKRAYVNVYSKYQTNSAGEQLPVYDSKLAMIPIEGIAVSKQLLLTNDIQSVFIRVLDASVSDTPLSAVVNIENNRVDWSF